MTTQVVHATLRLHTTHRVALSDLDITIDIIWQLYRMYEQEQFYVYVRPHDRLTLGIGIPMVFLTENQSGTVYISLK